MSIVIWKSLAGNEAGPLVKFDGGVVISAHLEKNRAGAARVQDRDHFLEQSRAEFPAAAVRMNGKRIDSAPSILFAADHSHDPADDATVDLGDPDYCAMGGEQVANAAKIESLASVDEAGVLDLVDGVSIRRGGRPDDHWRKGSFTRAHLRFRNTGQD